MKKHVYSIMALAGLLLASSCENGELNNIVPEGVENQQQGKLVRKEFSASVDNSVSRTALEGEKSVWWTKDDKIAVFGDGAVPGVFITDIQENIREATFSGEVSESADGSYKAFYPYQEGMTMNAGVLKFSLPSVQTATAGTFATMLNPAYAVSNGDALSFKNICSSLKITLTGSDLVKVSKIVLTASSTDRKLTGDMSFDFNNNTLAQESSAINTVSLEGSFEDGAAYYMIVAPGKLGIGSTFKFLSGNGNVIMTKTLNSEIELRENVITDLGTFTVERQTNYSMFDKGEIINIGGIAIQKQEDGSVKIGDASVSGIKVEEVNAATTITEGGIYFIKPEVTGLKINIASGEYVVVIGNDPEQYSKFDFSGGMNLTGCSNFLCMNMYLNGPKGNNDKNNILLGSDKKYLVFDGCYFKTSGTAPLHLCAINDANSRNFSIEFARFYSCNFDLSSAPLSIFAIGALPQKMNVEYKNNVFYSQAGCVQFKLTAASILGVKSTYVLENNIFNNVFHINEAGIINGDLLSVIVKNNVFHSENAANICLFKSMGNPFTSLEGESSHNISSGSATWTLQFGSSLPGDNFTEIKKIDASPFESFDFTDGTYVLKPEYSEYGPQI